MKNRGQNCAEINKRVQVKNGRAALASLANGRLRVQGEEKIHSFMQLIRIERLGYLPHVNFRLTPEELLRRQKAASDVHLNNEAPKTNE
jgi:hypothetical protein